MNDPYTLPGLRLTFADRLAWRRYERTYAPDGIHSLCKRNQETK